MKEIIDMLTSISGNSEGTNLQYRWNNKVNLDKEIKIIHEFTDKRMAAFYFSVLKKLPNTECVLVEQNKTFMKLVEYIEDDTIKVERVQCTEFRYLLKFISTLTLVTGTRR